LATQLLALVSAPFGTKYKQAKGKASQVRGFLDSVIEAAEDDEVSEKEFQKVVVG
jgi:hypothetical protein